MVYEKPKAEIIEVIFEEKIMDGTAFSSEQGVDDGSDWD